MIHTTASAPAPGLAIMSTPKGTDSAPENPSNHSFSISFLYRLHFFFYGAEDRRFPEPWILSVLTGGPGKF